MYVPPYESLLRSCRSDKIAVEVAKEVVIPSPLLKLLLQLALAHSDFDEEGYLRANPDVQQAVRRGAVESGRVHYMGFGYFEGRQGGATVVDENWYLSKYPDVALAIKDGRVSSATEHFCSVGACEGRSPSREHEAIAAQWKLAIVRS